MFTRQRILCKAALKHVRRTFTLTSILFIIFSLCIIDTARVYANTGGTVVYTPTSSNESIAYARVLRLQHSGSANGTLLSTFEHWTTDGSPASFIIEQSTNDGQSWQQIATVGDGETGGDHPWSHMWQPALFEFPQTLGSYSAGTLLLVGNVVNLDASFTHFESWRSTDHGVHWSYVSTFQTGGAVGNPQGSGIWEPNLQLDKNGNLICYFSDERQASRYSQLLGHIVSTDGGDSWGSETLDVASANQSDRPGMVTVVKLPNSTYIMSFEMCGYVNCEVHIKKSSDGDTWGSDPADLGTRVQTSDGRSFGHSPYMVWSPAGGSNGELILAAQREYYTSNNGTTPEDYRALMINTNLGNGDWSWMPAPAVPANTSSNCNTNYSPGLAVSLDGTTVQLVTPSSIGSSGTCEIRSGSSNAAIIPYRDPFGGGTDAGWNTYQGIWSVSNGIYTEQSSSTNGDKSLTGSTGWTDYTLRGDVELTDSNNAGFMVRVSNPSNGADAQSGYFVGLDNNNGQLLLGKQNDAWSTLQSVAVDGGVSLNTWYHVTIKASGCTFTVSAQPDGGSTTSFSYTDSNCFMSGQVGVRTWNTSRAAWKNISVSSI
ncbi:hypothetical protein KDA_50690 [Dictyobacter alpinus]|uniref:3-keto-alpha-glucoside-1,2-lyase/3-keto-2-hydroxy-glucal hydratase domain-containing protein n=1 Tax=Dictyobacter alpinus TaxID=2014873 RepID=A0A402BDZ7_9CHLR|nr:family 16 glycoside hydrolase [Dictyobacter alpinus]GCE29585.1 hypothetical protein KDA_50690 [Dictyobacter alpinus]